VTTGEILDRILVPRPNGSEALARVADTLESALGAAGAEVTRHAFTATPHGFQLTWTAVLLLMLGWAAALIARRYPLALLLAAPAPLLLLLEFEWMVSTVSALWPLTEHNVVGRFAGAAGGPTLVFSAHYDTTTHFGDHFTWGRWGWRLGPATGLALGLPLLAWLARRWRREVPRALLAGLAGLTLLPFAAMWWFHAAGPLLREPSPGALDNGGSLAALLRLAEGLQQRPPGPPTTVLIVFLAAEEERALGSWAYAATLAGTPDLAVVNLEGVGASDALALVPEDGWATRRVTSPPGLVAFVERVARDELGAPLPELALPEGVLTDGRSFLARGIPAITLRSFTGDAFPRRLHSAHDSRDRLSPAAIERSVDLLWALVRAADADPSRLGGRPSAPGRQ
jgi:hypothetical protein